MIELTDRQLSYLLNGLCSEFGYCLRPDARERFHAEPPANAAAFAAAVVRAEGLDPDTVARQDLRRLTEYIERHLVAWVG